MPTEDCTTVTPCYPRACRRCGGELQADASPPKRHLVWELPPIEPIIDEYQLHRGHCACCGITTQAELPEGVPNGQCGPRLAAFTGLLMGHFRQSKRRTAAFLGDLLNIPCSPAWTVKIQNLVSAAVAAPYEQLRGELTKQKQLFLDESPTKGHGDDLGQWSIDLAGSVRVVVSLVGHERVDHAKRPTKTRTSRGCYAWGSVMLSGSRASFNVASGSTPCSRQSSRMVLPVLKASFARAAAFS